MRNWVNAQKSRLNWKLKVTKTADNARITQSQARDTRYRRIQKLNSRPNLFFQITVSAIRTKTAVRYH